MTYNDKIREQLAKTDGEIFSLCKTPFGQDVWVKKVGEGNKSLIVTGGIHAREHFTAEVVTGQIGAFKAVRGRVCFFIPLVNPDGAAFSERESRTYEDAFACSKFAEKRELFKANANCVDLNVNFPARFGCGEFNVAYEASEGYIGKAPLCETESRALADFTRKIRPRATLSYHAAGRELYWEFHQKGDFKKRCATIASKLAKSVGVKKIDGDLNSAGGYKDFCIEELGIPAYTIEVTLGSHPLRLSDFSEDIELNRNAPNTLFDLLEKYRE